MEGRTNFRKRNKGGGGGGGKGRLAPLSPDPLSTDNVMDLKRPKFCFQRNLISQ